MFIRCASYLASIKRRSARRFEVHSYLFHFPFSTSGGLHTCLPHCYRFCKICYFFEQKGEKYFHGQWFVHGSKTLLQETAHPQSLFLTNACDNLPLASVFQKCNFRWLSLEEEEPPEDKHAMENDFYCRY